MAFSQTLKKSSQEKIEKMFLITRLRRQFIVIVVSQHNLAKTSAKALSQGSLGWQMMANFANNRKAVLLSSRELLRDFLCESTTTLFTYSLKFATICKIKAKLAMHHKNSPKSNIASINHILSLLRKRASPREWMASKKNS